MGVGKTRTTDTTTTRRQTKLIKGENWWGAKRSKRSWPKEIDRVLDGTKTDLRLSGFNQHLFHRRDWRGASTTREFFDSLALDVFLRFMSARFTFIVSTRTAIWRARKEKKAFSGKERFVNQQKQTLCFFSVLILRTFGFGWS